MSGGGVALGKLGNAFGSWLDGAGNGRTGGDMFDSFVVNLLSQYSLAAHGDASVGAAVPGGPQTSTTFSSAQLASATLPAERAQPTLRSESSAAGTGNAGTSNAAAGTGNSSGTSGVNYGADKAEYQRLLNAGVRGLPNSAAEYARFKHTNPEAWSELIRQEGRKNPAVTAALQNSMDTSFGSKQERTTAVVPLTASMQDDNIVADKTGKRDLSPLLIRFSQSSVNDSAQIIESMKKDGWNGEAIDIVLMPDGYYTTIDNTRVYAAQQAGVDVVANVHEFNETISDEGIANRLSRGRFIPQTWGEAVLIRISGQNRAFRQNQYGDWIMMNPK